MLDRPLIWEEKAFCKKTIDRLKAITGTQSSAWRMARARWLLEHRDTQEAADEAATLLRSVVQVSAEAIRPHLLLSRAVEQMDDPSAAIEQLSAVAERRPNAPAVRLRLAQLALRVRRLDRARAALNLVTRSDAATEAHHRRAASLFLRLGDAKRAAKLLRSLHASTSGEEPPPDLLLARCYRRLGKHEDAIAIGRKMLEKSDPRAEAVAFLANVLADSGRVEEGRKVLSRLSETAGEARRHRIRATFFARRGNGERALAALPEHAGLLQAVAATAAWRPLGVVIVRRPAVRDAAAKTLRLLRRGSKADADNSAVKKRLKAIADHHSHVLPIQRAAEA